MKPLGQLIKIRIKFLLISLNKNVKAVGGDLISQVYGENGEIIQLSLYDDVGGVNLIVLKNNESEIKNVRTNLLWTAIAKCMNGAEPNFIY